MARRVGSDGARTEAAIREAAIRLIARYGYEALSMRRLAQEVGVGAAALYRYFPNKQAILFGVLEAHMAELIEAWQVARPPEATPPAERLERFTRFHIRHHLPRAPGVFLSYMELRSLTPGHFVAVRAMRRRYEEELARILADGAASGVFRLEHPRVTARAIIAMLTGVTTWYREGGALTAGELEEIYWTIVARTAGLETREALACS